MRIYIYIFQRYFTDIIKMKNLPKCFSTDSGPLLFLSGRLWCCGGNVGMVTVGDRGCLGEDTIHYMRICASAGEILNGPNHNLAVS